MRISEVAEAAGVAVSTIRFYERTGVIASPARASNGYRDYGGDVVRQLRYLQRGQRLGFTLSELREFQALSTQIRVGAIEPEIVREAASGKLDDIDQRIAGLQRTHEAIVEVLDQDCRDLSGPCPIESALDSEL